MNLLNFIPLQSFFNYFNKAKSLQFCCLTVFLFFVTIQSTIKAQNWNYTYPTGTNKASISGIAPIGEVGEYIIQSTDGTVSKIDETGAIVWTLNEGGSDSPNLMQESVAVIGKYILAINEEYWRLIVDLGASANVLQKEGWYINNNSNEATPIRVKAINGDFIICGGLHNIVYPPKGASAYPDFLMRVGTDGIVDWIKSYSTMGNKSGGDIGDGVNLITDVEPWGIDKLVFVKSTSYRAAGSPDGGTVSIVNFTDGSVISHSNMGVQSIPSDTSINSNFVLNGGFWDIEVEGNKARMVGYNTYQSQHRALFCTYNLNTNNIIDLKRWEVPGKKLFLSKMQKIGGSIFAGSNEYVVSGNAYDEVNYTKEHVMISCNAAGTSFNAAYSVNNSSIGIAAPTGLPTSSTFYATTGYLLSYPLSESIFMLGSRTKDTQLPLVKKAASLSALGCTTDININSIDWNGKVFDTSPNITENINGIPKTININTGATRLVECCNDGIYSFGGPEVTISGELNLCVSNPTTLTATIEPYADPVSFLWSPGGETSPSIIVSESGTYTVTVESTLSPNCASSVSVTVTDGQWHKTTENTTGSEIANDVVTDVNGNVYVVGTFTNTTELEGGINPNITITGGGMYAAKYDDCGNLLWVSNTDGGTALCSGNSLVLDEVNQMLYITGTVQGSFTFNSSQSSGLLCSSDYSELFSPTLSTTGYIAQYDMITGCLYFVEEIAFRDGIDSKTITVNETNGAIYVGGNYTSTIAGSNHFAFIRKYTPETTLGESNHLGTPAWTIYDPASVSSAFSTINDLDFDESGNRIYAIGNFKHLVQLYDGTYTTPIISKPGDEGAFMTAYDDSGSPVYVTLRGGNGNSSSYMTGEGIAVEESTNNIFLTGSFDNNVTSAFSVSGIDPLTTFNANLHSYMLSFNLTDPTHKWAHQTHATTGTDDYALGKDVTTINGDAFFLGEFSGTHFIVDTDGMFEALPFIGNPMNNAHLGIVSYTASGIKNWINVTESQSPTGSDNHVGMAICSDNNQNSFVAGSYDNTVGYHDGVPYSGDLTQTGTGNNAFIIRAKNSSGAMQRKQQESPIAISDANSTLSLINLYPNPANSQLNLELILNEGESALIKLMDINGKKISTHSLTNSKSIINTENLSEGIYIMQIIVNEELKETQKIVIKH